MKVLTLSWVFLPLLFNISVQQCTIGQFHTTITTMVMSTEVTSDGQINSTYYNCLSRSDTRDHYSSMSVSILYIRSDDPNNVHEIRYNLQCNNNVWEIVGNQSTALRSNTSYDCSDCTDQTVNDYHCTNVKHSNINVISSFESVTLLEGDTVTLSCTPSIRETVLWWTHNGSVIETNSVAMLTPSTSDQNFIITNAEINDSGIYTCRDAMDNPVLQQNITVIVLPGCEKDFSGGVFWETSRLNSTVTQPCSRLHPRFRFGVNIKRQCYNNGSWSSIDLSDCTMYRNSFPVVIVYFTITSNNVTVNPDDIIDDVVHQVSSIVTEVPEFVNRTWNFTSSGVELLSISLLFTLKTRSVPLAVVENLRNVFGNIIFSDGILLKSGSSIEVLAFQPNSSCSCNVTDDDDIRTVCTGPSTPPCLCRSPESCICNSPTYVGDGNVCGLDSDSDGFPDVGLDCNLTQCVQDLCPDVFSTPQNDQSVCVERINGFRGCQLGQDDSWNMTWPSTGIRRTAKQKCLGSSETKGFAYRKCLGNNTWGSVNVSNCRTVEMSRIALRAKELENIVQMMYANTSDMTRTFSTEIVLNTIKRLKTVTLASQPILPLDLSSISKILSIITSVIKGEIDNNNDYRQIPEIIEVVVQLLDNVLDEENNISFSGVNNEINKRNLTIAEQLQAVIERTGILLSRTLPTDAANIIEEKFNYTNIVIQVQIPTEQDLMDKDSIEFSDDMRGTRMRIPSASIQNEMQRQGRRPPVVNIISRNIHLPTQEGERIASFVLSGKISTDFEAQTSLGDSQAVMSFSIEDDDLMSNPRCSFFSFSSDDVTTGAFSSNGVTLMSRNTDSMEVECATTHLTSFAVLVSGESTPKALSIVSYIGCAISIVCLLIAVCLFIVLRKKVFNQQQHFLHLNLSIALLLGLTTFVSGIETASEYRASCLIVAILLHYFFMAAFSWMLCEGILLFIMIKFVFYHGYFKRKLFFFLLGWGLPIPIVAVSAAVSHEQYGYEDKCWISEENGAIWAFIGPMLLIIMINSFFLMVTIYEVYKTNHKSLTAAQINYKDTIKSLLRAAIIIIPLLGITWVVGILAVNENTVVFAWIFTILNSLQGMFILILYVLKNEKFLKPSKQRFAQYFHTSAASSKGITVKESETSIASTILSKEIKSGSSDVFCKNETFDSDTN